MAQVGFNRELEIILVRLNVGGVNADEGASHCAGVPLYKGVHNNDEQTAVNPRNSGAVPGLMAAYRGL